MNILMLTAMLTAALVPDPNRNRMNDQAPQVRITAPEKSAPEPFGNRMNVRFEAGTANELTGAPNPYVNRMNEIWPRPALRFVPPPPPDPDVRP